MKTTGTQYWLDPNQDATNESGFSGLPGGLRNFSGGYSYVGSYGLWWSSSESNTTDPYMLSLFHDGGSAGSGSETKRRGFSVRCLRD